MKKLRMILALLVAGTLSISLLSRLLPGPSDIEISEFYSETATSIVLIDALTAMSCAVLFLMALRNFRPELKPAYRLMALSTLGVGVGMLVFPYIEYYGLWENLAWNMSSYLQYLIGAPLMYFGVRMFYKRVGLQGWEASLLALGIGILALSIIHGMLPNDIATYWPFTTWQFDLFKLATIIPIIAYGLATVIAWRVRQRVGDEYKWAFTWLPVGLGFYVIANIGIMLIEVIGYENAYYSSRYYTAPGILGDIALLMAGYSFAAIGRPRVALAGGSVTSMDIIIYAAGMASDQTKIDRYLDDMRVVTAQLRPGETPSGESQQKLRDVYLKIEDFLVTSDPLRTFQKDELRSDIAHHFGLNDQDTATFWKSL